MGCDDYKDYYYAEKLREDKEALKNFRQAAERLSEVALALPTYRDYTPPRMVDALGTLADMVTARIVVLEKRIGQEETDDG